MKALLYVEKALLSFELTAALKNDADRLENYRTDQEFLMLKSKKLAI